jgi:hypothetical protein
MAKFLAKILFAACIAPVSIAMADTLCEGLYARFQLGDTTQLTAEQARTYQKIYDVFDHRLNVRLAELPLTVRKAVEAKLEKLQVIGKMGNLRGLVVVGKTPYQRMWLKKNQLGDIYINSRLERNLYALFTLSHELEHSIDILKVKNRFMGLTRESFRVKDPFTLRTEMNAFKAAHSFFEELKARGVSLSEMTDLMMALDPALREQAPRLKEAIATAIQTGRMPKWFTVYDGLADILLMDRNTAQVYAEGRLNGAHGYRKDVSAQRGAALKQWVAVTTLAGIATYFGVSQMEFEKAAKARARK